MREKDRHTLHTGQTSCIEKLFTFVFIRMIPVKGAMASTLIINRLPHVT